MNPLYLILIKFFVELSENKNNEKVELPVELPKEKDQEAQVDESKNIDLRELVVNEPYAITKEREKR